MSQQIAKISAWIDGSYTNVDPEAHLWRRCSKVAEEVGEAFDALGGMIGENPRKGVTHTRDELINELLDVALAALGAVEHLTGNEGASTHLLDRRVSQVTDRAGLQRRQRMSRCESVHFDSMLQCEDQAGHLLSSRLHIAEDKSLDPVRIYSWGAADEMDVSELDQAYIVADVLASNRLNGGNESGDDR
jgi:NTP pyrophosphatase (non-canonical NTP hydrolase)